MLLAVSSVVSQYPVEEQSVFAHFIVRLLSWRLKFDIEY
jgi:hypothetical protein